MRDQSVDRFMPQELGRTPGTGENPACAFEGPQDVPRSDSFRVGNESVGGGVWLPIVMWASLNIPPWHRMTPRSMMLASSRTLPGQIITLELGQNFTADAVDSLAHCCADLPHQVIGQKPNVFLAPAQRRNLNWNIAQAIERSAPECPAAHLLLEVSVGSRITRASTLSV